MPEGTTGRFTDPYDYQTSLPKLTMSLVITQTGTFDAQLTSAKLPNLHLLRARETLARIAYISLPTEWVFVSFATQPGPSLFWSGVELSPGHLVFHRPGECLHQRTTGASQWGFLAVKRSFFSRYGSALAGHYLEPPMVAQIVRPLSTDLGRLLRLHARVAHVVETARSRSSIQDVGRGLEHDLLHALVTCLTGGEARVPSRATVDRAAIMVRLETALADYPDRVIPIAELCALVNVSARTLRTCCTESLGIDPSVYMRLRRRKRRRGSS